MNLREITDSIASGHGMTFDGIAVVAKAFGVPHILAVAKLPRHQERDAIEVRFLALAFALTQPASMKPPSAGGV